MMYRNFLFAVALTFISCNGVSQKKETAKQSTEEKKRICRQ